MSMVDDLRNMLIAHGIDGEKYTDTMLESIITEARLLVDEPYMFDTESEDYNPDFCDDIYMTEDYRRAYILWLMGRRLLLVR